MTVHMEIGAAIVGVVGPVVVAMLTRLPGLTADDRRRAVIVRDAELAKLLPTGAARTRLTAHLERGTLEMIDERERDKGLAPAWNAAVWLWFAAWMLLLLWTVVPADVVWGPLVRPILLVFAAVAAALVAVIGLISAAIAVRQGWDWLRKWPKWQGGGRSAGQEPDSDSS